MNDIDSLLCSVIQNDIGNRRITHLFNPKQLSAAVDVLFPLLHNNSTVSIISGFFIPGNAPETDGPLGTLTLARFLLSFNVNVTIICPQSCFNVFLKCFEPLFDLPSFKLIPISNLVPEIQFDVLVSIEAVGPSLYDGRCYTMKAKDCTDTAHGAIFAELFAIAKARNIPTIAVGDGGNELGMGNFADKCAIIPNGDVISCRVCSDHPIVTGVSNWAGLALCLAMLRRLNLPKGEEQSWLDSFISFESTALDRILSVGAVDGVLGVVERSVDGFDFDTIHQNLYEKLIDVFRHCCVE
ncbi:hypothetical protein P9112_003054 [Eukaryota sp. TZLM1-RC]